MDVHFIYIILISLSLALGIYGVVVQRGANLVRIDFRMSLMAVIWAGLELVASLFGYGIGTWILQFEMSIQAEDLGELVYLKKLSDALMDRIRWNYRFILGFNGGLIGLGALGILPPATSALLHNGSTVLLSANSMTPVLRES